MPDSILSIINEFKDIVKHCIRDELSAVIVYGSYARGDYHNGSDIDIMILVDTEDEKIKKYEDEIYDRAFDLELKYGIVISPIIKNRQFFEYWSDTLPFYRNIKKEGVKVA